MLDDAALPDPVLLDAVLHAGPLGRGIVVDPACAKPQGGKRDPRRPRRQPVIDWADLSETLQLTLSRAALRRAAATIAFQAETLAREMEAGALSDRGGPEALRLLAAVIRVTSDEGLADTPPAGS